MMRRRARAWLGGVACALSLCLALIATAAADEPHTSDCGWGPVSDVDAVRTLLGEWAASENLPPFDPGRWDASIDHSSVWVRLQFAKGELEVSWKIDDECEPTAIRIQTSSAYDGKRPDEDAVRRLVASFRTVTADKRLQVPLWTYPETARYAFTLAGVVVLIALVAMLVWVLRPMARRWFAGHLPTIDLIRVLGLVAIAALLPYESPETVQGGAGNWLDANAVVLIGILPLMTFLWLASTGTFGCGSPRREDWPALLVFLLALAVREGCARHAIAEIEIYFYYGAFPSRHSVVHPLFQMFMQPLASNPYLFMMHVNGVLGALATLPLFLFVRQRTHSEMTAALVATFYALHPLIVQMTPTDGQYALILSTWFAGLALLTADEIDARQLFAGGVLLGIAATSRAEGSLYLLASLLLIDVRALLTAARRHVGAAVCSACVVLGLIAVHVYLCFPVHVHPGQTLPDVGTFTLSDVLRAGLFSEDFNDPIFVRLVLVGALAGLVNKRMRIGLGAALAALVVVWPVSMATTGGFTILHRFVVVSGLQVIAAGVGAAWITSWLPSKLRHRWAAAIPAVILAFYIFAQHRHEVREPNAVTDEFWMLRNHLAPGGIVKTDCPLLFVGRPLDTDIHDFGQVLPGITRVHCEYEDCVDLVSRGGCFYYVRSLNCYFAEVRTPVECLEHGRTPAGDLFACLDPRCTQLERELELAPVEERTVDLYTVFHGAPDRPQWPRNVDIGLYKVLGVRQARQ